MPLPPEPFLGVWESSHYATSCCGQKANAGVLSSLNAALGMAYAAVVATLNVWITEHKGRWRASVPAERTAGSRRRGLRWHRCCGARWSGETGRCLRHESAIPERP